MYSTIIIQITNQKQSEKIRKWKQFGKLNIKIYPYPTLNFSKGLIKSLDLASCSLCWEQNIIVSLSCDSWMELPTIMWLLVMWQFEKWILPLFDQECPKDRCDSERESNEDSSRKRARLWRVEQRNKKTYLKFDAGKNRENVEY